MYFAFRKVSTPKPGGGTRVTEERSYFDDSQTLQKTRRTADFPAGVAAQIAANTPAVKLDLAKLTAAARNNDAANQTAQAILKAVRAPQFLIHDPAKGAPAEWQQVKLVAGTLSPDGRYALAWAPAKKDFLWANYKADDTDEDFWVEPGSEAVVNFIVDLSTHRLAGKTPGVHFGVRQNYNHYECIMAWSADSHTFIELNTEKWSYAACGCGRLTDGKLVAVADLGPAVEARAKALLKTTKHPGYRNHAKDMLTALAEPRINNDGNGSIQVVLQVPKSVADDAYANVTVRFHLSADNNHVEMLGAELSKEQ